MKSHPDIVEEETSNDEHFDKVCGLDQNQEFISPREKVMPSKNLEEKDVEIEIGSELETFYKKISESSYPKIVLTKLSEEEIKNFVDGSGLEPREGRINVKRASRKGDEVSRNEIKKNRKNGLKTQICTHCNID
ncbi:hypothetical protein Avbf_06553, partial [Armadillidium vulgare]